MNRAGQSRPGELDAAGARPVDADEPVDASDPAGASEPMATAPDAGPRVPEAEAPSAEVPGGWLRRVASRSWVRHLALLALYLAAGIALTWPRTAYLWRHLLPETRDVSGYVWDLWWTAHQVVHLSNPWYTNHMAAPVGIQLGFDTTMPLAGLIMTPVTLAFGPSASFDVLTILVPGLTCYLMYRAARLWLAEPGAIAAGALFGLSSMLAWQDWQHLNIALGTVFLPMTLEAAVRLRRRPGARQGVILGVVLGVSLLVNQESAVMAVLLAAAALLPWLIRHPAVPRLRALAWGAVAAVVVASPQLIAMIQQAAGGGASVSGRTLGETLPDQPTSDPDVIASLEDPVKPTGGLVVLRGSLAPRGALLKPSVASERLLRHSGTALVFDDIDDLAARIDDPALEVDANTILVLRNAGPIGAPGMPEWGQLPIPERLLRAGVDDMVRVSDARMSGTAFGTTVLHVAPEGAIAGPLAVAGTGDRIELDVEARRIDLAVEPGEIERRIAEWAPPARKYDRGYGSLFLDHVLQADEGCDFDFLRGRSGQAAREPYGILQGTIGGW